ncbi:MAG: 3-deoxy-manno-octulosonate cytidylyltransferase [Phycisphaeraceae bacterium]|nr:3-deoxy-manno-octulosonate cytidylyltransferase [Phycisphaeraceae bacterium]
MAVAIIPTRIGSTRFTAKALADRTGMTLTEHVYRRVLAASRIARVIVATDDERIAAAVRGFGGECRMTRVDHPNGSSRCAEVAADLPADGIIVNVQGDEPEIDPAIIDLSVACLEGDPQAAAATIASPFAPDEDPSDPAIVKVVCTRHGRALYFSRHPIPFHRDRSAGAAPAAAPLKHVGLYAFRRDALLAYPTLAPTPLEQTESLEQLRLLEHGLQIAVGIHPCRQHGIDTEAQYDAFVRRWHARQPVSPD